MREVDRVALAAVVVRGCSVVVGGKGRGGVSVVKRSYFILAFFGKWSTSASGVFVPNRPKLLPHPMTRFFTLFGSAFSWLSLCPTNDDIEWNKSERGEVKTLQYYYRRKATRVSKCNKYIEIGVIPCPS